MEDLRKENEDLRRQLAAVSEDNRKLKQLRLKERSEYKAEIIKLHERIINLNKELEESCGREKDIEACVVASSKESTIVKSDLLCALKEREEETKRLQAEWEKRLEAIITSTKGTPHYGYSPFITVVDFKSWATVEKDILSYFDVSTSRFHLIELMEYVRRNKPVVPDFILHRLLSRDERTTFSIDEFIETHNLTSAFDLRLFVHTILSRLVNLETLKFNSVFTANLLPDFAVNLSKLCKLDLSGNKAVRQLPQHWSSTTLKEVSFANTSLEDITNLSCLGHCLTHLSLEGCSSLTASIIDTTMYLTTFCYLESLNLSDTKVSNLKWLWKFKLLKELFLNYCVCLADCSPIGFMDNLVTIELKGSSVNDVSWLKIGCPEINHINLENCRSIDSFQPLVMRTRSHPISYLNVKGCTLSGYDKAGLASLKVPTFVT